MTASRQLRFTILGSYTGRNAGDCAILENVVRGIVEACPGAECEVLTINPGFVRDMFADLPLRPIRTMPWDLSVKTLGLPLVRSVLRSNAVVITSAILFDRKFWNPLYNYLSALVTAVAMAKALGKKVVFYSVGVGPVYTWKGRKTVRWLLSKADMITLREQASRDIIAQLGLPERYTMAADPALNQQICPADIQTMQRTLNDAVGPGPRVAINLNAYIDSWTGQGKGKLSQDAFCREIANAANHFAQAWDYGLVFICTQYMDDAVMENVINRLAPQSRAVLLKNRAYNHRQLMAAMNLCDFMIGMRLHCQILSVAAGTPCLALNYAPKVRNFMEMAGLVDYVVDFDEGFGADRIIERASHMRDHLHEIRLGVNERVEALKCQQKQSVRLLRELMGGT